jgi:hypothetical protein
VLLIDRHAEKQALRRCSTACGQRGTDPPRGARSGKSALLDYAVERAEDLQILQTVAVESEMAMDFAAVHQLLLLQLRLPRCNRRRLDRAHRDNGSRRRRAHLSNRHGIGGAKMRPAPSSGVASAMTWPRSVGHSG